MQAYTIFLMEIVASIGISVFVIFLIRPLLREVLVETCGTQNRANFWMMFTQLMMIISPLLIVIFFTHIDDFADIAPVIVFKDALFRSLLGVFIGLLIVGQIIRKSIRLMFENSPENRMRNIQE